jgi:hypothetical protein
MTIHLVTWDLIKNKDYKRLLERIDQYQSCRPMLSVALINANLSAVEVRDDLIKYVDNDDKIMVIEIQGVWATNFTNYCIDSLVDATIKI